jgi:hypothetical protein
MSEEVTAEATEPSSADAVASMVNGEQGSQETVAERPDNVPAKFWDDESKAVRTDAVLKSYSELEKRFGSFTGAPDEYEFKASEEMTEKLAEHGMELDFEDPLYTAAVEMAKETGMNQEGFERLANLYVMSQLGEAEAAKLHVEQERAALGERAEARINNLRAWGENNLSPEMYEKFSNATTTAATIEVFEHLIAQTRNAPIASNDAAPASAVSATEVQEMQFAKDEHGNRRIAVDPAFRAEYQRKLSQVYGDAENRVIIGG